MIDNTRISMTSTLIYVITLSECHFLYKNDGQSPFFRETAGKLPNYFFVFSFSERDCTEQGYKCTNVQKAKYNSTFYLDLEIRKSWQT